jgi:hypothetical protein
MRHVKHLIVHDIHWDRCHDREKCNEPTQRECSTGQRLVGGESWFSTAFLGLSEIAPRSRLPHDISDVRLRPSHSAMLDDATIVKHQTGS